ncbi:MAG: hypothetical protein JXB48_01510 [Candidatus Latescibacteria bacterium]|nr:hypothetical protein [Candidatus Latescibacterota bacterium]
MSSKQNIHITLIIALIIAVFHFIFLMYFFEPAISTMDANGYFNQAKLLATKLATHFDSESDAEFISPHWNHAGNNRYFSTYPPGFSFIVAPVYRILGPNTALLVNPFMASLSLIVIFLICSMWIGRWWGLFAEALMALNPVANEHALAADSHTSVLFFLVWALCFLILWEKNRSFILAFLTGLCLGIIPTIRYPEVLFAGAFGVYLLARSKNGRVTKISWAGVITGFTLPLLALLLRNQLAFGAFWKTGYSLLPKALEVTFGWVYFKRNALAYLQNLCGNGIGFMLAFGLSGITVLFTDKTSRKHGLLLALLILPVTLLYMFYFWPADSMSLRFLLPTFPVYIIAGVWFLQNLTQNNKLAARNVSVVLLCLMSIIGLSGSISSMIRLKHVNEPLVKISRELKKHVQPGNIVIADGNIQKNLDYIGLWNLAILYSGKNGGMRPSRFLEKGSPQGENRFRGNRDDDFFAPDGIADPIPGMMPGGSTRGMFNNHTYESFEEYAAEIRRWAGKNGKAYLILNNTQFEFFNSNKKNDDTLKILTSINVSPPENSDVRGLVNSGQPIGPGNPPGIGLNLPPLNGRMNRMQRNMQQKSGAIPADEPLLLVEWSWITH